MYYNANIIRELPLNVNYKYEGKKSHSMKFSDKKQSNVYSGKFAIGQALRIDPTNSLVADHNNEALDFYKKQNVKMYEIIAQDRIVD